MKSLTNSSTATFPAQIRLFGEDGTEGVAAASEPCSLTRPIHYLGSKLRLLEAIQRTLDSVSPAGGPVCDLFSGSGTVSFALSRTRDVLSVDIQEYSRVLCSALLKPAILNGKIISEFLRRVQDSEHNERLAWAIDPLVRHEDSCLLAALRGEPDRLCEFLERGSLVGYERGYETGATGELKAAFDDSMKRLQAAHIAPADSLAIRHFGGLYFSFRQAAQLDGLLREIHLLNDGRDTFLAALLSTASDVVNTVGKQFAQPIRPRTAAGEPKRHLIAQISRDRGADVFECYERWLSRYERLPEPDFKHKVVRGDYHEVLQANSGEFDVVYADPPYTRDHYSRYYHVLETFCLRDDPLVSTVTVGSIRRPSRGIYRLDRHQSPFCIKTEAPAAFATLFADVRRLEVPLVLSYSPYATDRSARPRLMTVEALVDLARKHFSGVDAISAGKIAHNKLNTTDLNFEMSYDAEILLVCKP